MLGGVATRNCALDFLCFDWAQSVSHYMLSFLPTNKSSFSGVVVRRNCARVFGLTGPSIASYRSDQEGYNSLLRSDVP